MVILPRCAIWLDAVLFWDYFEVCGRSPTSKCFPHNARQASWNYRLVSVSGSITVPLFLCFAWLVKWSGTEAVTETGEGAVILHALTFHASGWFKAQTLCTQSWCRTGKKLCHQWSSWHGIDVRWGCSHMVPLVQREECYKMMARCLWILKYTQKERDGNAVATRINTFTHRRSQVTQNMSQAMSL